MRKCFLSIFFVYVLTLLNTSLIAENAYSLPPYSNLEPLDRLHYFDKRQPTMQIALTLMQERGAKKIVETGTARYGSNCYEDGCSTLIWGQWAKENDAKLYTVDKDPNAIAASKEACAPYASNIKFFCSDSVSYLKGFSKPIDLLYLDSYDYDPNHPLLSQLHTLNEVIAAYPCLTMNSIVLIDDCDLPGGGKGALAIPHLQKLGWKILAQGYQVLLVQN